MAALARSRGQLAGHREGDDLFGSALQIAIRHRTPFEEARTRLLYGEWLRRGRRRIDAREQLRAARSTFERLGAASWAAGASQELAATGETLVARADGDPIASLTAQERRVAVLAADGLSNRAIATRPFLSPKTIESHLHRVYRKLGVARRAELTATLRKGTIERDSAEIGGDGT